MPSEWMTFAAAGLSVCAILYSWITSRSRENSQAIAELAEKLTDTEHRWDARHQATLTEIRRELKDIYARIDDHVRVQHAAIAAVDARTKQIDQTVSLIQRHLLGRGGGPRR